MKSLQDNKIANFIIAIFAFTLVVYVLNFVEQPSNIIIEPQPSEYPDWDAIKGKDPDSNIKNVLLTKDCPPEGCKSDKPATQQLDAIDKQYKLKGRFSRAYLYSEIVVDYRRPLTAWDDIYFRINGFGGHLIKDENLLPVPPGETSKYLYDLRSISYYPTIKDKENRENRHNNINLFYLLQDSMNLDARVFISSDRPGRVMKEISIYYECFEASNCSIEEVE